MATRKVRVKPFGLEIRTGTTNSILSRLYRTTLHDLGITFDRYNALMSRYIAKAALDHNRLEKAAARTTLSKELLKESMTWKTFLKGLAFLNVKSYTIILKGEGKTFKVHVSHWSDTFTDELAGTVLAELLSKSFGQMDNAPEAQQARMDAYINKSYPKATAKDRSAIKSSLVKELSRPNITWNSLIKGYVLLGVEKLVIELLLDHENHRKTHHQTIVLIDGVSFEKKE